MTEEHKRKISEASKGKTMSKEARENMRLSKLGIKRGPCSDKRREAIRASKVGHHHSEETKIKIKIKIAHIGKIILESHRNNISKATLGSKNSNWKNAQTLMV